MYPRGIQIFSTTDLAHILNKCPYFKKMPDTKVSGMKPWQKIKLHYVKGSIFIKEWEPPLAFLSPEMKHALAILPKIYDYWDWI